MESKDLIEAGLTENQAKVYLELIRDPAQTGGQLAKGISMDRSFVYNVLSSLSDKGLVSHSFKDNVKIFYPTDPELLLKETEEKKEKILKIVKELKKIKGVPSVVREVLIFDGKAGLKVYMRDLLKSKQFSSLSSGGLVNIFDVLKVEFPHYLKIMKTRNIRGRVITSFNNESKVKEIYSGTDVKVKVFDGLDNNTCFTLFNNQLAIYSLEDKPYVVLIKDKHVAETLKAYFNLIWKSL
jgi:HTH-type transcriptional regulator, sugar sensing transcriptional regulator